MLTRWILHTMCVYMADSFECRYTCIALTSTRVSVATCPFGPWHFCPWHGKSRHLVLWQGPGRNQNLGEPFNADMLKREEKQNIIELCSRVLLFVVIMIKCDQIWSRSSLKYVSMIPRQKKPGKYRQNVEEQNGKTWTSKKVDVVWPSTPREYALWSS